MTQAALTEQEDAILKALFYQRVNHNGDIFAYDFKAAQDYLNKNNYSVDRVITESDHFFILNQLSDKDIIDIDFIFSKNLYNALAALINYERGPITDGPDYSWSKQKDWAMKIESDSDKLGEMLNSHTYKSGLFIRMTTNDIESIKSKYMKSHKLLLKFNELGNNFFIKIDDGSWQRLPALHKKTAPLIIIQKAWANKGKFVSIKRMKSAGLLDKKVNENYLESKVFERNRTVRALHPLFIDFDDDKIRLRTTATCTSNELFELKSKLNLT